MPAHPGEAGYMFNPIPYGTRNDGLHGTRYEILTTRALCPPIIGKWALCHVHLRMGLEVMAHTELDMRY